MIFRQPAVRIYDLTRLRPVVRFDAETGAVRFLDETYFMQGDPRPGDEVLLRIPGGQKPVRYRVTSFRRPAQDAEAFVCQAAFVGEA